MTRSAQPPKLDPQTFPLHGCRLIEAGAGTGKTYTIAALYLRLVLGHGGTAGFGRTLTPPEILVVTFTEAATQELRDRIRARLADAAAAFAGGAETLAAADPFLCQLAADYPPEQWPACAYRLQSAAEWMDEAAVSTIHGWCNRMLREHAFASDSLFTQELATEQDELVAEAVRDYWRTWLYPLDSESSGEILRWWDAPARLQMEVLPLLAHAGLLAEEAPPIQALIQARCARQALLAELKAPWSQWAQELKEIFDAGVAAKLVNGRKLQSRWYDGWLRQLASWAENPAAVLLELGGGWFRLSPEGMQEAWKDDPPDHPAFAASVALQQALAALPDARPAVLRHATRAIAARIGTEKARRAQMDFDDLLLHLRQALAGGRGQELAGLIRQQFPVALIDEFQDTDTVQYEIFRRIYGDGSGSALILIGDPKQAIYSFRGADIHAYLAARADTTGQHYTLRQNFRSTSAMVTAVNRCFLAAEERVGRGAFGFREADGSNPLPFIAAEAQGRAEVLQCAGKEVAALTFWHLPSAAAVPFSADAGRAALAATCADTVAHLLAEGRSGRAGFQRSVADVADDAASTPWRPLTPADCAILVNSRIEAAAVRQALARHGVRSVYLSDRDSVLETGEASDLQHLLSACAEPDDGRRLRAALATATLALDWTTLDALNHDETAWEARILQFRRYHGDWQQLGVLPMLHRLLHDFGVPARLLGDEGGEGERRLTNLLHLAELLQHASQTVEGEHALIRHLAELRAGKPHVTADERQIRLESDADLVQVVTVHKSKGLEYPLVFLPFAAFCRTRPPSAPLFWPDREGRLQLRLEVDEAIVAEAGRERLGEDLRKLYVALTRARFASWVGIAPMEQLPDSALADLLGIADAGDDAIRAALQALSKDQTGIVIDTRDGTEEAAPLPLPANPEGHGAWQVCQVSHAAAAPWWVASYSALRRADADAVDTPSAPVLISLPEPASASEAVFRDSQESAAAGVPLATSGMDQHHCLHNFPRGAAAGTFLHELLEWVATQGFARIAAQPRLLRETVTRRCQLRGWGGWSEPLSDWLLGWLQQPWPMPGAAERVGQTGVPLVPAQLERWLAEMEFWIAARHIDIARLDALVCQHTLDGAARPALAAAQVNGMFKGFIDLVVEHDGRHYVVDYKSNHLGDGPAAYTPTAMQAAVLQARYDLQYVLYLFALHRLLRQRLPDYDYERHVGGALYLFLRGSDAPGGGVFTERPPQALFAALDRLFDGEEAAA